MSVPSAVFVWRREDLLWGVSSSTVQVLYLELSLSGLVTVPFITASLALIVYSETESPL